MKKIVYAFLIMTLLSALAFAINYLTNQSSEVEDHNIPVDEHPAKEVVPEKDSSLFAPYKNYKLINAKVISPKNSNKYYETPLWSPAGDQILVTTAGGIGLYTIAVISKNVKTLNDLPGAGYGASWSLDGKNIFYRKKIGPYNSDLIVESLDVTTGELSQHDKVNPNGLQSYVLAKQGNDPIVYINTKTLAVEATSSDKSKSWTIVSDGQYYHPVLSPDKSKVAVHRGNEILVYAVDGSGLIVSLGSGIATSWSQDSRLLLAFLDESEDGHQITGSELYLLKADGSQKWQLTSSPDIYEMWPSWSPDNTSISFADNKSGQIYTANIVFE